MVICMCAFVCKLFSSFVQHRTFDNKRTSTYPDYASRTQFVRVALAIVSSTGGGASVCPHRNMKSACTRWTIPTTAYVRRNHHRANRASLQMSGSVWFCCTLWQATQKPTHSRTDDPDSPAHSKCVRAMVVLDVTVTSIRNRILCIFRANQSRAPYSLRTVNNAARPSKTIPMRNSSSPSWFPERSPMCQPGR